MEAIYTIPALNKPYYISKSELALQLTTSGRLGMTIIGPDSLIFVTKINGLLEGWALIQSTVLSHPIPFFYLLDLIILRSWRVTDINYGATRYLEIKMLMLYLVSDMWAPIQPQKCSAASCVAYVGTAPIGGMRYPTIYPGILNNAHNNGIIEMRDMTIGSYTETDLGCTIGLPIRGGRASSDAIKLTAHPGPSLILWHDSAPLFPATIDPSIAIPANYSPAPIEVGYMDNTPGPNTWHVSETVTPVFTFVPIGTLTPTQLQVILRGTRNHLSVNMDCIMYDHPTLIDGGGFKGTENINRRLFAPVTALHSWNAE